MRKVLREVQAERHRQDAKWGEQNHAPMEWLSVLMEEVGEAARHALEDHFIGPGHHNEPDAMRVFRYRREMIEVAAVAVAAVESLDRNMPRLAGFDPGREEKR